MALTQIKAGGLADDSVDTDQLAADAVENAKIADNAVDTEHLADDAIEAAELASDAVVTASIADNQVTLAKMAGGTDGNIISYDASGDPVAIATGSDGQVLTSTGAGSPPAFEAAGGIAHASIWRLTTTYQGDANPISSNWEATDSAEHANDTYLGTAMTESSGVFSFPSTGFWLVRFFMRCENDGTTKEFSCNLKVTVNNSNYDAASKAFVCWNQDSGNYVQSTVCENLLDVTNVSNVKVSFQTDGEDGTSVVGASGSNQTYVTFIRLGDT